ncbi:MAG: ribbon-helix-helix protein, CopG family [Anaerolineales bacterium]|nr:ribbon-helix-helix protein, CopG family [Anaerolineales bacterium]MCB9433098.1 ribbon-helix-helix protein, CopG family [Ardenticatenaceae bacterium]
MTTKTIHVTISEELLEMTDTAVRELKMSRSAFMRYALQQALRQMKIAAMEQQHEAGYKQHPVEPGEFDSW